MSPEEQQPLFKELAADLPDNQKAEFFRTLHEIGISPNDVELGRLLRALQLYKAYYETIPSAVKEAAGKIEHLKQEIERISNDTRGSLDAGAQLTGQVIQETEKIHQDLTQIQKHVEEAMRQSAPSMASHMAEQITADIEQKVLSPLQNRLDKLAGSNKAFDDAIVRNNKAAAALEKSTTMARRFRFWTYALGGCAVVCSFVLVFWFFLHRWYADQIDQECAELIKQVKTNRAVLQQLSKSHRTLELLQDPTQPNRKLLIMKDASGWQSASKQGVIEFDE